MSSMFHHIESSSIRDDIVQSLGRNDGGDDTLPSPSLGSHLSL